MVPTHAVSEEPISTHCTVLLGMVLFDVLKLAQQSVKLWAPDILALDATNKKAKTNLMSNSNLNPRILKDRYFFIPIQATLIFSKWLMIVFFFLPLYPNLIGGELSMGKTITYTAVVKEMDSIQDLTALEQTLIRKAIDAAKKAYAPYSRFNVGASVLL